ncbi:MAG: TIGR00366 family protein, partial [Oscillospiraceae bacterium]|nr:TIGR00366 family protein [Oscillospiraceae bacterium]
RMVQRYLPDPFLFALILTAIAFLLGIAVNHDTPMGMVLHWGDGLWKYLAFSMQMVLVVVLGNVLAVAPVFQRLLKRLAEIPKSPKQAVAFCTLVAGIACMIQWGFGLVIGALFAKELAKRVRGVDYRLLIAAAYSTFMLTVPTSSMILKAASNPDDLAVVTNGAVTEVISIFRTAYYPPTMIALIVMFIGLIILNANMHPSPDETFCIDPVILEKEEAAEKAAAEAEANLDRKSLTPAEKIENSRIVSIIAFVLGAVYLIHYFAVNGWALNIDIMNLMLLTVGMLLHRTPIAYVRALGNATKNASGIILQFPFYAGIMGMMVGVNAAGMSLAATISDAMVSIATVHTYPMFSFLSAAIVNMFIPSAGGQWGVQAPIMFPAGKILGVDPAITTVALTWGDTWTNMIQPFWALPALGIAGLKVRDIMGFCVVVLIFTGIIIVLSLLAWIYIFGCTV